MTEDHLGRLRLRPNQLSELSSPPGQVVDGRPGNARLVCNCGCSKHEEIGRRSVSGYEPGHPKIEWRDAEFIWVGTRLLNAHGQEFVVTGTGTGEDGHTLLFVVDHKNGRHTLTESAYRCRVEPEDR